ncbi:MAG TPA: YidC/Oxa1 family membrane protein insertase [Candidatus Paceibacterota bacterium]|nr:YidC/Oxa1 family membrane protein insertase [Candidatus Paceibacterota bacterium]
MISVFFHAVFYNPIYNALIALIALVPGGDVGVAVILLTISIRLILLPFSLSAARTQRAMKALEPKIKALKEAYKDDKEREAVETLALYKAAQVNPFASILTAFIQIPVLLALYWVFRYESFTVMNVARLYAFTPTPHTVSLEFLGIISVMGKSLFLAVCAGLTQLLQAHMALSGTMKPAPGAAQGDFQKIIGMQLKYVFPFLIAAISYTTSGAVALYFIATNLAGSAQEWHVRRTIAREVIELESI